MVREYGLNHKGNINCKNIFTQSMKYLCGQKIVLDTDNTILVSREDELKYGIVRHFWNISEDMIETNPRRQRPKRK